MTDYSETEIDGARFVQGTEGVPRELVQGLVVVSGPDADGDIVLLASGECYLARDAAQQLAAEILRRLAL